MSLNLEILSRAADQARGLRMDAVQASKSGHLGLPLGCAEMGAVLYGHALKYNPDNRAGSVAIISFSRPATAACFFTPGCI